MTNKERLELTIQAYKQCQKAWARDRDRYGEGSIRDLVSAEAVYACNDRITDLERKLTRKKTKNAKK